MPPKRHRPQVAGPGVGGGAQAAAEEPQAQGGDVAAARVAAQIAPVQGQVVENDLADGLGQGAGQEREALAESESENGEEGEVRGERRLRELEARIMRRIRTARAGDGGFPTLSEASVGRALFSIKPLVERDFEVWLQSVSDAFWGAGLFAMFRMSAFSADAQAAQEDRARYGEIPDPIKGLAWTALRGSIGPDTAAYATLMSIEPGDVLGLLRSMRANFERKSIPFRHQLLADLAKTNLSDFSGVRQYVAALDTFFSRLAKLGHVVADKDKLYHLTQG